MIETELKLTATDKNKLEQVIESDLIAHYRQTDPYGDEFDDKSLHAIYYDTENLDLRSRSFSLRSRKEGDKYVLTLKFKGEIVNGLSTRKELEEPCHGFLNTVGDLPPGEIKNFISALLDESTPLIARVEVKMQRSARYLKVSDTVIEIVSDSGLIKGPSGRSTQLHEIELELKKGDVAPMIQLGQQLQEEFNLTPSTLTKHGIGLSLG